MSAQSEQMQSRLAAIRDRIAAACRRVGRDPDEVELLPVSKTQPVSALYGVTLHIAQIELCLEANKIRFRFFLDLGHMSPMLYGVLALL